LHAKQHGSLDEWKMNASTRYAPIRLHLSTFCIAMYVHVPCTRHATLLTSTFPIVH